MKHSPIPPTYQHDIRCVHAPIVGLMDEVMWQRVQPTHALTGQQDHRNHDIIIVRSHRDNRRHKQNKDVEVQEHLRLPNVALVDGFEFLCHSTLESAIKAELVVSQFIVSRLCSVAHVKLWKHFRCLVGDMITFECFGDVRSLELEVSLNVCEKAKSLHFTSVRVNHSRPPGWLSTKAVKSYNLSWTLHNPSALSSALLPCIHFQHPLRTSSRNDGYLLMIVVYLTLLFSDMFAGLKLRRNWIYFVE